LLKTFPVERRGAVVNEMHDRSEHVRLVDDRDEFNDERSCSRAGSSAIGAHHVCRDFGDDER